MAPSIECSNIIAEQNRFVKGKNENIKKFLIYGNIKRVV
jgi:hypothetical protein